MSAADLDHYDPDRQLPLPMPAIAYAQEAMRRAHELDRSGMGVQRDLPYGSHRLQRYNVFAPHHAQAAPVLIFWHGGGWTNGYRDYVSFMAPAVVRLGMVLVAPSYRLAPECPLPAALDDSRTLLDHVRHSIAAQGGDPGQVYLAGHSAGGHLAAMTALLDAPQSQSVRGCLPLSGIMDLRHPAPPPGSLEERVYTMVLSAADQDAALSPVCRAADNQVPFVLSYGEHDTERVIRSNRAFAEVLTGLGRAPVQLHQEVGADHFQTHTGLLDGDHPWYRRLVRLVEKETP